MASRELLAPDGQLSLGPLNLPLSDTKLRFREWRRRRNGTRLSGPLSDPSDVKNSKLFLGLLDDVIFFCHTRNFTGWNTTIENGSTGGLCLGPAGCAQGQCESEREKQMRCNPPNWRPLLFLLLNVGQVWNDRRGRASGAVASVSAGSISRVEGLPI